MVRQLLENTAVRVTSAITVLLTVAAGIWTAATWATNVSRDVREIRSDVSQLVNQVDDRWRRADMATWVKDTEKLNHNWIAAEVPKN